MPFVKGTVAQRATFQEIVEDFAMEEYYDRFPGSDIVEREFDPVREGFLVDGDEFEGLVNVYTTYEDGTTGEVSLTVTGNLVERTIEFPEIPYN